MLATLSGLSRSYPFGGHEKYALNRHPLAKAREREGSRHATKSFTNFARGARVCAVPVLTGGCSQQCSGKPDLYGQYRELQPDTAAVHCSSARVHGVGIRLGPELSDGNRVPRRFSKLSSVR